MAASEPTKRPPPDVAADRRKQILKAAVEVFAERGFHKTRVSDIAKRAGVAHGLIYHYFDSKDEVLSSVFEDHWALFVKVLREFEADPERRALEKLQAIADLLMDALHVAPTVIQVVIQEISRSDRFIEAKNVSAFEEAFGVVRAIIQAGQASGELKAAIDPQIAAYAFFGALETIATGFLLRSISFRTDDEVEAGKRTIREIILAGMLAPEEK